MSEATSDQDAFKAGLKQGWQQGLQVGIDRTEQRAWERGREQGQIEGLKLAVYETLEIKFGSVPTLVTPAMKGLNLEALRALLHKALTCETIMEFIVALSGTTSFNPGSDRSLT
jgi:flagellar biosynthesis/type III secretory pathway protein FliH